MLTYFWKSGSEFLKFLALSHHTISQEVWVSAMRYLKLLLTFVTELFNLCWEIRLPSVPNHLPIFLDKRQRIKEDWSVPYLTLKIRIIYFMNIIAKVLGFDKKMVESKKNNEHTWRKLSYLFWFGFGRALGEDSDIHIRYH